MKKAIYLIIALIGLSAPSCSDSMLDFSPTDSGSGKELLKSASTAITSVNGVYRSMWTAGWSTTANTHQCFGIAAYNLALDCMADDLIMQSQGNGWFWGDHCYNVKSNYTSSAFRSYDVWYANYKWIANVNYIIDAEPEMAGTEADVAYVAGQAYAIRALCYLNLATWFSRAPYNSLTGASRWNEPCVPVYTTGTSIDTGGQPRESLRTVYGRIDQDIDRAIELLEKARETTLAENNKSHINLYVALGIKSRACLAEGDWDGAFKAAKRVIDEGGYAVGTKSDLTGGMNSLDKQNVMWGAGIQVADQAGGYAGFFTHMDNKEGAYAKSAPKLISKQLYNRISATDIRRDWWDPSDKESPYVSKKFSFANVASFLGDYIYMRTIHDGFHLFDREMLFNVKTDPHEVHNIAKDRPDLCAQGARMILEWQEDQMKKSDTDVDPMWTVMRENGPYHIWGELDGYLDRLEKTGRHEAAVKLRAEYKKDDK